MTRRFMGRPLEETLAAVAGKREVFPVADKDPRCATCHDTGWQELLDGTVKRCWKGCDIPRRHGEYRETYSGPEIF